METMTIVCTGRLKALPPPAPRCGDEAVAVAYPFDILQVQQGVLPQTAIGLAIPCPEQHGEGFFTAGGIYRMHITPDLTATRAYTVYNSYAAAYALYWCREIEFFS